MFKQLYLENKKPYFLASKPEQVYAAILKYSKSNDPFQNCQTYSPRILEISGNFLGMVSIRVTATAVRKNEAKTSKDGRHLPKLATSCKEIVSSNTK